MKKYFLFPLLFASIFSLSAQVFPLLDFVEIADGFNRPVDITHAGDGRLFVVEQPGRIMIIDSTGTVLPTPFLDIRAQVDDARNEQGLLGLVFHPQFKNIFYVNYTDRNDDTQISRFAVNPNNPNRADPNSELKMLTIGQPFSNHNGGQPAFGPDGKLYLPVGAPCNICESKNEMYASITRMNPDGSDREVFAHGVRNTVGFTWHPETGDMWFTDNGRDWLGNDEPPCELNRVTEAGQHFGYPYCHGGYLKDPEFGDKFPCDDFIQPAQNLGPHVAPLGLKFCNSASFPSSYQNKIFIAEHGSWNREAEVGHSGHKITLVTEENGKGVAYEDFATGFLNTTTNTAWARPVDIVFAPDGSMLVSDDLAGTIFRIFYRG